jgi:Flp pilus assembly protein TadG
MIKRLWNDRRGVAAWVVAAAMVPLLGIVSLGTEVGSWYVIRRNAQNAADAAAVAGATALAVNDPTPGGAVTAGQAFANSNGFATGGGCLSTATTGQNVCITSSGAGAAGTNVTAVVKQYETPIFTQWFVPKGPVTIQARAVATIQRQTAGGGYCTLARTNLDFRGNFTFYGGCGLVSNGTVDAPPPGQNPFYVPPGGENTWTMWAAGACNKTNKCSNLEGEVASYKVSSNSPVPLPPALVNLMANTDHIPTEPSKPGTVSGTPSPSTTKWLGNYTPSSNVTLSPGVYMFDSLQVNTGITITGTGVNIVIGSGGLSGKGTMNLTAGDGGGVNGFPDMNGVAIYDPETNLKFTGQFTGNFNGALYFPNATLTFRGGSNLKGCMVLVANQISFGGDSSIDTSGCSASILQNDVPQANVVMLTQ